MKIANKLVRDNIPDIIRSKGGTSVIRILNNEEYRNELIRKMHEEVNEFDTDDTLEELGDIFAVLEALAEHSGYSITDVVMAAEAKAMTNGKFNNRYYMSTFDVPDNK